MNKKQPVANTNICRVAIFIPLRQSFDYLIPKHVDNKSIQPGIRVLVPFGGQKKIGIITHTKVSSSIERSKLKHLQAAIDTQPLFNAIELKLMEWSSNYYHHPLGDVISRSLPGLLRKNRAAELPTESFEPNPTRQSHSRRAIKTRPTPTCANKTPAKDSRQAYFYANTNQRRY